MKVKRKIWQCLVLTGISVWLLSACVITERAYRQLSVYNYFAAKKNFYKLARYKRKKTVAYTGLAIIYGRSDNPFTNLDSAFHYIHQAKILYPGVPVKTKNKWKEKQGVDSLMIDSLYASIGRKHFEQYKNTGRREYWEKFLNEYKNHPYRDSALYYRDKLIVDSLTVVNTPDGWKFFLENYPESYWKKWAEENYYKRLYEVQTASGTKEAFEKFLNQYPDHPWREKAFARLFELYTKSQTVDSLLQFVKKFPGSPMEKEAWRRITLLSISDWDDVSMIHNFLRKFPDCKMKAMIGEHLYWLNKQVIAVVSRDTGYLYSIEEHKFLPGYWDNIGEFKNGTAPARKGETKGVINRSGQWLLKTEELEIDDYEWPFLVVKKDEKYGLMDITGKLITEIDYEDLYLPQEGWCVAAKNGKYGYIDTLGREMVAFIFDNLSDLKNGRAVFEMNNKMGIFDKQQKNIHPPAYEWINIDHYPYIKFKEDDRLGLMYVQDTLLPARYNYIDILDSMVIVEINDTIYFYHLKKRKFEDFVSEKYAGFQYLIKPEGKAGLFVFSKNNKLGMADVNFRQIIKPDYVLMLPSPERNYVILQKKGAPMMLYDIHQKQSKPLKLNFAGWINDTLMIVKNNKEKYGVMHVSTEMVVPDTCQKLEPKEKEYLIIPEEDRMRLYKISTGKLTPFLFKEVKMIEGKYLIFYDRKGEFYLTDKNFNKL